MFRFKDRYLSRLLFFFSIRSLLRYGSVALMLAVAGCESFTPGSYFNCPSVSFLGGAEKIIQFQEGPSREIKDILIQAEMTNLGGSCRFSSRRVEVMVIFDIIAERGPSNPSSSASLPFFLAVLGAEGEILVKTTFVEDIDFHENRLETWSEEIDQEIFLFDNVTPLNFEILVGFQLTPDQLDQNFTPLEAR